MRISTPTPEKPPASNRSAANPSTASRPATSRPAIQIENLGKSYRLQQASGRHTYSTLRESLTNLALAPIRRLGRSAGAGDTREFWALKDVNLEIPAGEVVGVVGRNGAGKSTLLKILSRITRPTTGRVTMHGRVGSLLEVGTGFHPELTGRENIFLNGAILGMGRKEIVRKFDQIVDFSGVEAFLDTPVKRYSSGMHVRLAFAVAAHLDPEILLVDEVLAVGDLEFQRKCLGQMEAISRSGRTVVFVSHNMAAVEGLCRRGVVIEAGGVHFVGSQTEAVRKYLQIMDSVIPRGRFAQAAEPVRRDRPWIEHVEITSQGVYSATGYPSGAPLEFRVRCQNPGSPIRPALGIGLDDGMGHRVTTLHTDYDPDRAFGKAAGGTFEFVCRMQGLVLRPGDYRVKLSLEAECGELDVREEALMFTIQATDYYQNGGRMGRGVVLCDQSWSLQ